MFYRRNVDALAKDLSKSGKLYHLNYCNLYQINRV